ncbi:MULTISPECIES: hypothetical protein [unclassified Methylobacterium]|nr:MULTISPECIES: hypothetical protein [unclassified Methylobacterium]
MTARAFVLTATVRDETGVVRFRASLALSVERVAQTDLPRTWRPPD